MRIFLAAMTLSPSIDLNGRNHASMRSVYNKRLSRLRSRSCLLARTSLPSPAGEWRRGKLQAIAHRIEERFQTRPHFDRIQKHHLRCLVILSGKPLQVAPREYMLSCSNPMNEIEGRTDGARDAFHRPIPFQKIRDDLRGDVRRNHSLKGQVVGCGGSHIQLQDRSRN